MSIVLATAQIAVVLLNTEVVPVFQVSIVVEALGRVLPVLLIVLAPVTVVLLEVVDRLFRLLGHHTRDVSLRLLHITCFGA